MQTTCNFKIGNLEDWQFQELQLCSSKARQLLKTKEDG